MENIEEIYLIDEDEDEGFVIKDDKAAEWALKKVIKERAERDRLKELCDMEIEELNKRKDLLDSRCESKTGFLMAMLMGYFATVEHKETKTKESYKLLSGSLVKKKGKLKTDYDDEKLLAYLKANKLNEFIKTTEKVAWKEFKDTVTITESGAINEDGEIIDGITVEESAPTFDVEVNK